MTDKEKVIIGLEHCTAAETSDDCAGCPYDGICGSDPSALERDALALLTDTTSWIKELNRRNHWHCEKCGCVVGSTAWMYTYCPACGRKVTGEIEFDG